MPTSEFANWFIGRLKNGEEIKDGKLYGWTGRECQACGGTGASKDPWLRNCIDCAGTGEEWGLMPVQPNILNSEAK